MALPRHRPPKTPRVRGKRRWGEGTYAWPLRPLLLLGAVMLTSISVAAMLLLPTVAIGNTAQKFTKLGCPGGVQDITLKLPKVAQRSVILANDGTQLARLYLENRKVVKFQNIAPIAKKAVLGIEDYQFYQHGGIDLKSIGRALIADIKAGTAAQGGSTISQQLVKVITDERADTVSRKLCEAEEAMLLEKTYTKNTILEMYLNEIYLGHGAYGLEAAAETYFGTHASSLTLAQSAMLAGMIQNPSEWDPIANPAGTMGRRNTVLDTMAKVGFVPEAKAKAAEAKPLGLIKSVSQPVNHQQPLFVQFVRKMIEQNQDGQFDVLGKTQAARDRSMFQGGLTIETTIDPAWQKYAIETINHRLPQKTDPQAAIATVEPGTGAVRVLASGRDFAKDPNHTDFVWNAIHQEGSSFKPFTLVAAFREGIPPGQVYPSYSPATDLAPFCNGWAPTNAEGGGDLGFMNLYTATADSINAVFGRLAKDVGPPNIGRAAEDMGIHLEHPVGEQDCSVTLGTYATSPLDMATAYATLAAGGLYCPYYGVEKIIGPGPKHKVLYQHDPKQTCKQTVKKDIAYQVTDMLKGVIDHGTGTNARLPDNRPEAGKTGTTDNYENAWFCGYVPQVATAVWMGYPGVPREMIDVEGFGGGMFGGDIPALMWHDVMTRYTQHYAAKDFPAPPPPQTGQIPSVIGKSQTDALATLAAAHFVGVVGAPMHSTLPVGVIAGQSPGAGSTEDLGFLVNLYPSDGIPPKAIVPNVVGKKGSDASGIISGAGFTPSITLVDTPDYSKNGVVLAQAPHGGAKVLLGSTVTLSVGHFVKASPPPPPPTTPPPPPTTPPPTTPPPTTPPPSPTPKPTKTHHHGGGGNLLVHLRPDKGR